MEFRLLGALEVEANGVDLTPARKQHRALLVLLLLHEGEVVAIDVVLEALWGDRPPQTAHKAIQGHISALRKSLGPGRIETRPPGYLLRLAEGDQLDIRRVEEIAAAAQRDGRPGRSEKLREALALFHGEPLVEFRYEAFASEEASRLDALRLAVLEEQIDLELQQGRHEEAVPELEGLIAENPFREGLRAQLMLALYRSGRQADALQAYQEARSVLVDELGVEPSFALQRLERQILNQDPALAAPDSLAPARHPSEVTKPVGIVTFLFAEIEVAALEPVRTVVGQHGGFELDAEGDSFLAAFARARDAVAGAIGIQRATKNVGRPRIGINSADEGHWRPGVRSAASISSAAHGGQILFSQTTRDLLRETSFDEVDVRDLGEHRLNDLTPAQRLFQLSVPELDHEFPALRSLETRATNLPVLPTPLVGREREIREVADLLRSEVRVVTLAGTGGTGKTRLGLHIAAELLDDFDDGVFFVTLAPLTDPELVLSTVARILGVLDTGGETLTAALGRHLRGRRLLLVLDNFEHLLEAAPCVADIAAAASGSRVLVTSRAPLHLAGERVYLVSPLETPIGSNDVERLLQCDSVALFASRAHSVRPDFAVTTANARPVAQICDALEGLPLAIELAATRVGVVPPGEMLQRLDDRLQLLKGGRRDAPERQRTLRATIDWSYDLLEPQEQLLFARLAVFAGGFTLQAGESICGSELDVVDGLASLTDNGLVGVERTEGEPRFTMLETIREYAAELLELSDEASTLRRRHAEHFLALAEEAEPNLIGVGSHAEWLDRLERDHDNVRAALGWLEASGDSGGALRLTAALWRFWDLKGHLIEGRRYLGRALNADERPTAARAKALSGAADMALTCGDVATGRLRAEEALELYHTLGDDWGTAFSLLMFAYGIGQEGDWARAQQLFGESVQRFRGLGDEYYELRAARAHGWAYYEGGELQRSRDLFEDILPRARATHNELVEAIALCSLADIAADEARVADGIPMLEESQRLFRELDDLLLIAAGVGRFARLLAVAGRAATAAQVLSSSTTLMEEIGARPPWFARMSGKTLADIHAQLDEAAFAKAWEQGLTMTADEAVALALDSLAAAGASADSGL